MSAAHTLAYVNVEGVTGSGGFFTYIDVANMTACGPPWTLTTSRSQTTKSRSTTNTATKTWTTSFPQRCMNASTVAGQVRVLGSAQANTPTTRVTRLTSATSQQGLAWVGPAVVVWEPLYVTTQFRMTAGSGTQADGLWMYLTTWPVDPLSQIYTGATTDNVAPTSVVGVEVDLYDNTGENDPANMHMAVFQNSRHHGMDYYNTETYNATGIVDGNWHKVILEVGPAPSGKVTLELGLDGAMNTQMLAIDPTLQQARARGGGLGRAKAQGTVSRDVPAWGANAERKRHEEEEAQREGKGRVATSRRRARREGRRLAPPRTPRESETRGLRKTCSG